MSAVLLQMLVGAAGVPDTTAPTITSSSSASVNENATLSFALTANESVTWSIVGGADSAQFQISGSTLQWSSNGTRNYEAPADANTDNAYIVQVRATDLSSNTTDQTITITVNDVGTAFDGTATNATLSNSNLTVSHTNTTLGGGRSTSLQNSGKYYFEVTATTITGSQTVLGIITSAGTYTDISSNGHEGAILFPLNFGQIWSNNGYSFLSLASSPSGGTYGAAVDLDNDKVWFRLCPSGDWNGAAIGSQNPATNTGGASISSFTATTLAPVVAFGGTGNGATETMTANFGGTSYSGTPPSGFSNWPE